MRGLIYQLLVRIGRAHPQSLMYPLLVAAKSQSGARREAAWAVLDHIRQHSPTLVEQAQVGGKGGGCGGRQGVGRGGRVQLRGSSLRGTTPPACCSRCRWEEGGGRGG